VVFKRNDILNFIEVKYQNNAKLKDTDALVNIAGQKPESNFIFLTKNSSDTTIQKRKGLAPIIVLPVHTFVYWIG
jgi:Holliday junction resolvase-like predicted endonuclease